jgi:hypothetical protein
MCEFNPHTRTAFTLRPGDALADDFGVAVDEDGHNVR